MKEYTLENQIEILKAENERLKKENDLKTGWISLISHDFKEAFGSTLLLIDAFENKSISEAEFFTLLPQVKQDAQKNLQAIIDTGTWIKTQGNGFHPQLSEVYAVELFEQIKQEFEKKLQNKQLQFTFQGCEAIKVNTDQLLILFILKKIVDNAIKYSSRDSYIYFRASETKNGTTLSIVDQGIGMNERQTETLFSFDSPVFRGTGGETGAGLSLILVIKFVRLLNGNIKIKSVEGKGTIVSIILPPY